MAAVVERFILNEVPKTVYYIPDCITPDEEQRIMSQVNNAPKPKWTQLKNRRLQNWGGIPHPKGMIADKLPDWLSTLAENVAKYGVFGDKLPNHVLVNEYLPGQGIMPHLDGPLFYPTITTISCGSHTVLNFYHPLDSDTDCEKAEDAELGGRGEGRKQLLSLLVERRSLLIIKDEMYHHYLHGISECKEDVITNEIVNLNKCKTEFKVGQTLTRGTRISLTIRHVPKTTKLKLQLSR